jgi:uncharacterized protein (DUF1778 family)
MSESTRTKPVSCRVEPAEADAFRVWAEASGQTVSSAIADMIRGATSQLVTRATSTSSSV